MWLSSFVNRWGINDYRILCCLNTLWSRTLLFIFVMIFVNVAANLSHAKGELVYSGEVLGDKREVEFTLADSEYAIIRASQLNADYRLTAIDKSSGIAFSTVDFDAYLGLDEILLVEYEQCKSCVLIITGKSFLDHQSPYHISINTGLKNKHSSEKLDGYRRLNGVGRLLSQTNQKDPAVETILKRAIAELENTEGLLEDSETLKHHILLSKALLLFRLGSTVRAKSSFDQVIENTVEQHTIHRAQAFFELGAFEKDAEKELSYYVEGTRIARQLNNQTLIAQGLNYQAINRIRNADFDIALNFLDQAYELAAAQKNWRKTLDILHNLSWGSLRAGKVPRAIAFASQQKVLAERFQDEENILWALYNVALAYGTTGDIHIGDQFLEEALDRLSSIQGKKVGSLDSLQAYLLLERAQRYLEMGAVRRAEDNAREVKIAFKKLGWSNRVADADFLLGDIAFKGGDVDKAENLYKAALEYDLSNSRDRSAGLRYLKLAEININKGRYRQAEEYQESALKKIEDTQDYRLRARARSLNVELQHHLNRDDRAHEIAVDATDLIQGYGSLADQAKFAYRRAIVYEALGETVNAIQQLELARKIVDKQISKVKQGKLRQEFLALFKDIYAANIRLFLRTNPENVGTAIELVETFKARTLKDKISRINFGKSIGIERLTEREEILNQIRQRAVRVHTEDARESYDPLAEGRKLSASLERLEASILKEKAAFDSPTITSIDKELVKARPGELIAYYFLGRDQSWLWVITEDEIKSHNLPDERVVSSVVEGYLTIISKPPAERFDISAWDLREKANAISDMVLKPLDNYLEIEGITHISIVADGALSGVPLAALTVDKTQKALIERFPVSYLPSLSTRAALENRSKLRPVNTEDKVLVFANPLNSSHLGTVLTPLPYTSNEASIIANLYGSRATILEAEAATKANFLSRIKGSHSILHIATHGLVNHEESSLSSLVFSASENADGLLLLPEISALEFDISLLVLSACESGIGESVAGEGFLSLSRAFLGSGVSQVVGSLWQVHDGSTAKLMHEFYVALKKADLSVADALRQAQLKTLREPEDDWSDPYYWAGFQLVGSI